MLFNSFSFALFFVFVLIGTCTLPRSSRSAWLLGASLLFYALWIPTYLVLLLATIGVNYALLRAAGRTRHPRGPIVASIVFTLALLAGYKYAAWAIESAAPFLATLGIGPLPVPELFLPLGISFYSFQIIALSVDVLRGQVEVPRSLSRYALFVSFFPQLIAGPIVRGAELLPQLERGGERTAERTRRGVWLLTWGLVKKVVLADFLLAEFVDVSFRYPGVGGALQHWIAAYAFAFQIYFDFSGYSDMARGLAKLLGFELPLNFREPYLSRSPAELWRRWHITLSAWLRDYLYIPLGGNRRGAARTFLNLFVTMLLGGLWHGAAWTFVCWGGLHGLLLAIHRFASRRSPRGAAQDEERVHWRDLPSILLCFHAICVLWVFFRAESFDDAWRFLGGLVSTAQLGAWPAFEAGVVLLCGALHVLERKARLDVDAIERRVEGSAAWLGLEAAMIGGALALCVFLGGAGDEFIYFQF